MCESKVVTIKDGNEVVIMEDVVRVEVRNDKIKLYGLLGESKEIKGKIIFMDLMEHKIVVEEIE